MYHAFSKYCGCIGLLALSALPFVASCKTAASAGDGSAATGPHRTGPKSPAASRVPRARTVGQLEVVATFSERAPAGIAVSKNGRKFLSFPRHDPGVPYTVGELVDGDVEPYPGRERNRRKPDAPESHFLSVEGIVVGPHNDLWVLDTGRPDFQPTIRGGGKLVQIDLETDEIARTYVLPPDVADGDAFLADVRIDRKHGDEGYAYITDASPSGFNGLIVVDLATGESWRKLDLHPSTRADPEFIGMIEGRPFLFDPEDRPASHLTMGANGIAIGDEGERLYFRVLAGRELYSVRTDALIDRDMPPPQVENTLRRYGELGFASDGLAADDQGRIYLTNYEDHAVMRRHPNGGLEAVVLDPRLLWPDSLAVTEGALYITVNQTHREGVFNNGRNFKEAPYVLFRTPIDAGPVQLD